MFSKGPYLENNLVSNSVGIIILFFTAKGQRRIEGGFPGLPEVPGPEAPEGRSRGLEASFPHGLPELSHLCPVPFHMALVTAQAADYLPPEVHLAMVPPHSPGSGANVGGKSGNDGQGCFRSQGRT